MNLLGIQYPQMLEIILEVRINEYLLYKILCLNKKT
jgi:hypothetical protein